MNRSKANDDRFKKIWRASGALGPKIKKIELPGAENFSQYLGQKFWIGLSVEPAESQEGVKNYLVKRYGKVLGTYSVFDPRPDEDDFVREFNGRIPGYVNDVLARRNRKLPKWLLPFAQNKRKKVPVDTVILTWANEKYGVDGTLQKEPGKYWYRHDRHETIAFP